MSALPKNENLNVRVSADKLELLKRGAEASGKSLSAFVIEAAAASAEKAVLDQRIFHVDADVFDDLTKRLSRPGKARPKLVELFKEARQAKWANSNS